MISTTTPPSSPSQFRNISVPESARVGTRLALSSALDPDANLNGRVERMHIEHGNEEARFAIVRDQSGAFELELISELDRENRSLFVLNISATDGGRPPRTGFLTLFLNVLDANDNAPVFAQSHYYVSVPETLPAGSSVTQVSASDADATTNAELLYFLSNDDSQQFQVDSASGLVTTRVPKLSCPKVAQNDTRRCVFSVEAVDHGTPAQRGRAFVNLEILDENDHAPRLLFRTYPQGSSVASILEDAQVGSVVAVVTTVDDDTGNNGLTHVQILAGNELRLFRLDSNPLFSLIRLAQPLPSSLPTSFNLTIQAKDKGTPPKATTAFLPIFLRNSAEQPPAFNQTSFSAQISENAPIGSFVASLVAHSPTGDSRLPSAAKYAVDSGNELGWFSLDPDSGFLTTAAHLDFEQKPSIQLSVSVKDSNSNLGSSTAAVAIHILDANDHAPVFSRPAFRASVLENAAPGKQLLRITAEDADSGSNGKISFTWAPGSEIQDYLSLDAQTGEVTLARSLDREAVSYLNLTILAVDGGSEPNSATASLFVQVEDENDSRPVFYPTQLFVAASPHSDRIATCSATDDDSGKYADVRYLWIGSPTPTQFTLDPVTGVLRREPSTALSPGQYSLVVGGMDGGGLESSNNCTVRVFVAEGPAFAPIFSQPSYELGLLEDSGLAGSLGRPIGSVSASDPDAASAQIQYVLSDGDPARLFSIGPYSGEIRSLRPLDRESRRSHRLLVTAIGRHTFSQAPVTISVLDQNDNAPKFLNPLVISGVAEVSLPRDAGLGALVFQATASDPDDGDNGNLTYSLAQPTDDFLLHRHTGFLSLKRPASLLAQPTYTLQILVQDAGEPRKTSFLTLKVDVPDAAPGPAIPQQFQLKLHVQENAPLNSRLHRLQFSSVLSADQQRRLVYRPAFPDPEQPFGVLPDGWLYVRRPVDYETTREAQLVVEGRLDDRLPLLSVSVTFLILDVNDNTPTCGSHLTKLRLRENSPPYTSIGFLRAEDPDSALAGQIRFQLIKGADELTINSQTGQIHSLRPLDREALLRGTGSSLIAAEVKISDLGQPDSGSAICRIEVEVEDENDGEPQFTLDLYSGSVVEGGRTAIGAEVLQLSATDEDDGANLAFSIATGNQDHAFNLDPHTGRLTLGTLLSRHIHLGMVDEECGFSERIGS